MLRNRRRKLLLIMMVALNCAGFTTCHSIPDHNPYLMDLAQNRCIRFKLVDKDNILYDVDTYDNPDGLEPCSDLNGGFGLRPGEFEKLLQAIRDQKKACEKP